MKIVDIIVDIIAVDIIVDIIAAFKKDGSITP